MAVVIKTVKLNVKGTSYYNVERAFDFGDLEKNKEIILKPEPENIHDPNAVEVYSCNKFKLGHISKDISRKYQKLCNEGKIIDARIYSSKKNSGYFPYKIIISVKYTSNTFNLHFDIPEKPGVYRISLGKRKIYVGSTANLFRRCKQHIHQLIDGCHFNKSLQDDFSSTDDFSFEVIEQTINHEKAELVECNVIQNNLKDGVSLYNKTHDGKGRNKPSKDSGITISDMSAYIDLDQASYVKHDERESDGKLTSNSSPNVYNRKDEFYCCIECKAEFITETDSNRKSIFCPNCGKQQKKPVNPKIPISSKDTLADSTHSKTSTKFNPTRNNRLKYSSERLLRHQKYKGNCNNCGMEFGVTMARGEEYAKCPFCFHANLIKNLPWSGTNNKTNNPKPLSNRNIASNTNKASQKTVTWECLVCKEINATLDNYEVSCNRCGHQRFR